MNLRILTLNCGSSSIKYSIWDMPEQRKLCNGIVEKVTVGGSFIRHEILRKKEVVHYRECPTHDLALEFMLEFLTGPEYGVVRDLSEIDAVGHRVVHGGETFRKSTLIDEDVIRMIEKCAVLAPLHNPPNLLGIKGALRLMPNIPHIAIFDTAFLATIPKHIHTYALPYKWYENYGIRRYGFHGSSHLYVSRRASALLGKKPKDVNLVTLHIGNGVSITAIRKGEAFDHSMGFTPLEGAVMGTRCGDIDPAIPLFVMQKEDLTPEDMDRILNKESGLLGITGKYTDRRDIIKAAERGDERAKLAMEIECYRLKKYIGAYLTALGRVDAIVFTAGVGENSPQYRSKICEGLEFIGLNMDEKKNLKALKRNGEAEVSSDDSRIKIFVIPTDEELVLAEDVSAIIQGKYDSYIDFEYSFQKPGFTPSYLR